MRKLRPLRKLVSKYRNGRSHFALRLRPPAPARPYLVAVVRGERQEAGVVDRLVALVAGHHDLHIVVETGGGHAAQVREGPHVLADRGLEVLRLREVQVLPPRVAQDVTEQVDSPPPLLGEVDLVGGIIHLRLLPFGCLESQHRLATRLRAQPTHQVLHDRVLARETPATQLLMNPQRRHGRPARQEILNEGDVLVQDAAPRLRRRRQIGMRRPLGPSRSGDP